MARHVLLNNIDHADLRVITRHAAEFGHNVASVLTFPTEYSDVHREYPVLFSKDPGTGRYQSVAILGFQKNENLFLDETGWHAHYVPGTVARGPFLIGFQDRHDEGDLRRDPVIHVDLDDPRVNRTEGEPVFLEHGGNSPYLERIAAILKGINDGMSISEKMFSAFESCDLIEPLDIQIDVHEDLKHRLTNFYTVSESRLARLSANKLAALNRTGFLAAAFLLVASLDNIKTLIQMKRKRILQEQQQ
jgi:hypothetical protein